MGFIHKTPSKKHVDRDSIAPEPVLCHLSFHIQPSTGTGHLNICIIIKKVLYFVCDVNKNILPSPSTSQFTIQLQGEE
jgi:hypothetical protein